MSNLAMTGTFSKSPLAWGFEEDFTITGAHGATVTGSDGKDYIDWVSGLGSNLLGYGTYNKRWADEVQEAVMMGAGSLSLPYDMEGIVADRLARLLEENIPYWSGQELGVRFAKTGTDATTMAIRLARAVTERENIIVIKGGYHGWADWSTCITPPARGILEDTQFGTHDIAWGSLENLEKAISIIGQREITAPAAIIIEYPLEDAPKGYFDGIRELCDKYGALFIMDEVVTGLRYGLGGVSGRYNIKPDLVCMGKALGNGAPISALVGFRKHMSEFSTDSPVFCSSTMWGEGIGLHAAWAVLETLQTKGAGFYRYIRSLGGELMVGLQNAGWRVKGHQERHVVEFGSDLERAFFIHGMREHGHLMNRPNFVSLAHSTDNVSSAITAVKYVRYGYEQAIERDCLEERVKEMGNLPRVLFRER